MWNRIRATSTAGTLLLLSAIALPGQRSAVGGVTLELPPGWEAVPGEEATRVRPRADPGAAAIHLPAGQVVPGDLRAWFSTHWRSLLAEFPPHRYGEIEELRPPGLRAFVTSAELRPGAGAPFLVGFFAVAQGTYVQPILITFRDPAAVARYETEAHRAYGSIQMLPVARRPAPQPLALARLIRPAGGGESLGELSRENVRQAQESARARTEHLTDPARLRGSTWIVASYHTPDRSTVTQIRIRRELRLGADGSYQYTSGDDGSGAVTEAGRYEIHGDRLVLRRTGGTVRRQGRSTALSPAAREYRWWFGHDPEMLAMAERVPAMRSSLACPGASHCFTLLYLRDASGREEMWRPH